MAESIIPFSLRISGAGSIILALGIIFNAAAQLPEGNTGIASKYPGDNGIGNDTSVIFADDFEHYSTVKGLAVKWDVLINDENLGIDYSEGELNYGKSLLMTIPKREDPLTTGVSKLLRQTTDVLFVRWYMKFEEGWEVPGGSVHNGASVSANYFKNGNATPGVPANGQNKFLVNFENENSVGISPGNLNVYVYWPGQGSKWGDHFFPSGLVLPFSDKRSGEKTFGGNFQPRSDFAPQTGRWYCYEYMVKANKPGKNDGRIAIWIDGKLIGDFPNLQFRDVEELKIDRFGLGLYIANNTVRTNKKWHDNVVAANSYIGPIMRPEK